MKKSSIRSQTSHIQVSEWQYQWVEALSCKHWRLHASFFYFSNYRMNLGEKWWQLPLSSRGWHIAWSSSQDMIRMSSSLSSLIAEISDISIGWVNWTLSIYHIEITTTKHTFCIYFPFMFFLLVLHGNHQTFDNVKGYYYFKLDHLNRYAPWNLQKALCHETKNLDLTSMIWWHGHYLVMMSSATLSQYSRRAQLIGKLNFH